MSLPNIDNRLDNIINNIDSAINDFMTEQNINDLKEISMSVWNGLLLYIKNKVFYKGLLKPVKPLRNEYDYNIISDICDYYIYLCFTNDKEISVKGFCLLTGITNDNLYNSLDLKYARDKRIEIWKKLTEFNEESLANVLYTGKRNPVGIIAILNHRHNWQTAAAAKGEQKPALKADQLPDLSLMDGQKQEKPGLLDNMHKEE